MSRDAKIFWYLAILPFYLAPKFGKTFYGFLLTWSQICGFYFEVSAFFFSKKLESDFILFFGVQLSGSCLTENTFGSSSEKKF